MRDELVGEVSKIPYIHYENVKALKLKKSVWEAC